MSKDSKFVVKGKEIPSTQSSGLAPRAKPVEKRANAPMHSSAFLEPESKIVMKGQSNARDNRYK